MRESIILKGKKAEEFRKLADYNYKYKRHSIDFSKELEAAKQILSKAKL